MKKLSRRTNYRKTININWILKSNEFQAENIHLKDSFSQLQCEKNELEKTIEFNLKDFTEKKQKNLEELKKKHQDQIKEIIQKISVIVFNKTKDPV